VEAEQERIRERAVGEGLFNNSYRLDDPCRGHGVESARIRVRAGVLSHGNGSPTQQGHARSAIVHPEHPEVGSGRAHPLADFPNPTARSPNSL